MEQQTLIRILASCVFAAGLSGCSTTGGPSTNISSILQDTTGQNGRACIDAGDIRGYGVLEKNVISIDAFNKYYLATVLPGCTNLEVSTRAIFEQRFAEVCGGGMDSVRTGGDNCTIRSIFEFEDRSEAFAAHEQALAKQAEIKKAQDN
ncbi:DUF6491 family protein [Gilvimarinus sp. DA14]|uniref:DUF6491 family protein n=1 Tax=Gilvimarinus sp. DA14 TaxID=2956798 RepID=UPI0020B83739|nr:DUF6491 family protein [Gilvimarinus sp. DA14]UTF58722.1 DUF6491 family protein [Gilvimarinus sp. DA14]